ncbi:hypothetical protein KBD34_04745 [Patescibacteria group bacterium]|nr:hypothetical protein [Patescibacteria group bacterium]
MSKNGILVQSNKVTRSMIQERYGARQEELEKGAPLPIALAERFVTGHFFEGAPTVHEGDKTKTVRWFERKEEIPTIKDTSLSVLYRKYHELTEGKFNQIQFSYARKSDNTDTQEPIAEMGLGHITTDTFSLYHRYVYPEFRGGKGIGTRLYLQVEDWLSQVAQLQQKDVHIELRTGQQDVISWAQKMGYAVDPQDSSLLKETEEQPEHFIVDSILDVDGVIKARYLFRLGVDGRTIKDAIRLRFQKTIPCRVDTTDASTTSPIS